MSRIKVLNGSSPNEKIFCVTRKVSNAADAKEFTWPLPPDADKDLTPLGPLGIVLVKRLIRLSAIRSVLISQHRVLISLKENNTLAWKYDEDKVRKIFEKSLEEYPPTD